MIDPLDDLNDRFRLLLREGADSFVRGDTGGVGPGCISKGAGSEARGLLGEADGKGNRYSAPSGAIVPHGVV